MRRPDRIDVADWLALIVMFVFVELPLFAVESVRNAAKRLCS